MRIEHAVLSYHPRIGAVEANVQRIARGYTEAGDEVTVLAHEVRGCPADERMGPARMLRFPLADLVSAHCYRTLVSHAAVSSHLPFVFTPYYHRTGHTKLRKLLHRVYRPAGARLFNTAKAAIGVSDAERPPVVGVRKTVTTESA